MSFKLQTELASFRRLWKGGFFNDIDGDGDRRLTTVFATCVAPHVQGRVVLEIGPGRGAWTKKIVALNPVRVYCVDALSAEHNQFWQYIGHHPPCPVDYQQVHDFSCSTLQDDTLEYVFSFDVFCHISYTGCREYLSRLRPKLRRGAVGFIMFADADKFRRMRGDNGVVRPTDGVDEASYDGPAVPGRWYWIGVSRFCELLRSLGYEVLAEDVQSCPRDPICHFRWPG